MKGFNRLTPELLARYAAALNITPDELVDAERIRERSRLYMKIDFPT